MDGRQRFIKALIQPEPEKNNSSILSRLRAYLNFRAENITTIVNETADIARENGLEVGLDCFSPTTAYSVGQDLENLDQIGDWIKPMTCLHAFAPDGILSPRNPPFW